MAMFPLNAGETWANSLCINLTNKCNTFCKYCFQDAVSVADHRFFAKDIKRVFDYFKSRNRNSNKKKHLQLTGGEPTIHPEFFEIMQLGLEYGYVIRLQTNGLSFATMTEPELSRFNSPNILIKISLDGWDSQTHEYLRV